MRYMVENNFVNIVGRMWLPPVMGATSYSLSDYDLKIIGKFTRKNVWKWLATRAGDFQEVIDFYATAGDTEIEWENLENKEIFDKAFYGEDY